MNKYFIFGDTHGRFDSLEKILSQAGYDIENPKHILLSLGDNFDRGDQNDEILRFLNRTNALLIKGNHEDMLLNYLTGLDNGLFNCTYNGLQKTLADLSGMFKNSSNAGIIRDLSFLRDKILNRFPTLLSKLSKMPDGYKIDNYILTHAGFSTMYPNHESDSKWFPDNWTKTPEFIKKYNGHTGQFKFVFGHWHAGKLTEEFFGTVDNENHIFEMDNFIGIDACTNLTKRVNILIIESDSKAIPFSNRHNLEEIKKL